jgi:hypothetical protein
VTINPSPTTTPTAPAASAVKLAATQKGQAVKGSLTVTGPNSRLKVEILRGKIRVAASTTAVKQGNASFSISLNGSAKQALRRAHKLKLTVKVTVTPASGTPFTITKTVTLKA